MGLDAFVRCNCFEENKTTTPPVDRALLRCDDDGYLNAMQLESMTKDEYSRLLDQIYTWTKNCCSHQGMHYCREAVGNWASVRFFQQVLRNIGIELFPVLSVSFPNTNGGYLETELVHAALEEMRVFKEKLKESSNYFLIDALSGKEIYSFIEAYRGKFLWHPKGNILAGFDESGLFVQDTKRDKEIFRSMHLSQKPVKRWFKKNKEVLLTDFATRKSVHLSSFINRDDFLEMKVIKRSLALEDFIVIAPLEKLFKASIETGNPVYWT